MSISRRGFMFGTLAAVATAPAVVSTVQTAGAVDLARKIDMNSIYGKFAQTSLQNVATNLAVPYEELTKSYERVEYSSARQVFINFHVDTRRYNADMSKVMAQLHNDQLRMKELRLP